MSRRPEIDPKRQRTPPSPPGRVTTSVWDHSRRYAIFRGNDLLGTTNLEYPVVFGERAAGRFFTAWSFRKYESVFQLYAAAKEEHALRRYLRRLEQLGLEIWDSAVRLDGRVDLISAWNARTWMIHVTITDARFWRSRAQS